MSKSLSEIRSDSERSHRGFGPQFHRLMSSKKVFALCALCLLFAVGFFVSHFLTFERDRELIGPVTLGPEWLEIEPKPPLKPSHTIQSIAIVREDPFAPDPEIQLVDQYGSLYYLTDRGSDYAGATFTVLRLPRDRDYKTVRIRSATPIRCLKVVWHCYDMK